LSGTAIALEATVRESRGRRQSVIAACLRQGGIIFFDLGSIIYKAKDFYFFEVSVITVL
jgi:hypothetical protein